jgi:hypothetical protein
MGNTEKISDHIIRYAGPDARKYVNIISAPQKRNAPATKFLFPILRGNNAQIAVATAAANKPNAIA